MFKKTLVAKNKSQKIRGFLNMKDSLYKKQEEQVKPKIFIKQFDLSQIYTVIWLIYVAFLMMLILIDINLYPKKFKIIN